MSLTATDFFCGMGGSSSGLVEAGFTMKLAANHWDRAIETHSANHPDVEHICADLQAVDVRYLPKTDVLWASPICTEVSPAGGRRRKGHQLDLFEDHGHVPTAAFERTRVTFWEVIRAAEVHRYKVVMIENVVEAADWELFDTWVAGMEALGYVGQFISASSAHMWSDTNAPAPQWRDRIYGVFVLKGILLPDMAPTPLAWCEKCDANVAAVQWWKPNRKRARWHIGKYGPQYLYVCPVGNHGQVEPYVAPAAAAIDWTDLGERIGDRKRLLSASTMRRVQAGLDMIAAAFLASQYGGQLTPTDPRALTGIDMPMPPTVATSRPTLQQGLVVPGKVVMSVNHDGDGRHFDPSGRPLPTETVKRGEALLMDAAFVATLRNHATARPASDPLATITGGGFHHALVIPYRRGCRPYPADHAPVSTVATRDQHAVMRAISGSAEDAYFRMLKPRESATAQRFAPTYVIHGTKGEQQMQAGNAVSVNAAHHLGARVYAALDGRAA